jgi:hypothetical protein
VCWVEEAARTRGAQNAMLDDPRNATWLAESTQARGPRVLDRVARTRRGELVKDEVMLTHGGIEQGEARDAPASRFGEVTRGNRSNKATEALTDEMDRSGMETRGPQIFGEAPPVLDRVVSPTNRSNAAQGDGVPVPSQDLDTWPIGFGVALADCEVKPGMERIRAVDHDDSRPIWVERLAAYRVVYEQAT